MTVYAGDGGAAAAAARIRALKASGVLVQLAEEEFLQLLRRSERPLVVEAPAGLFGTKIRYLTSYKGLAFHCKCGMPIQLPAGAELVQAKRIWIP